MAEDVFTSRTGGMSQKQKRIMMVAGAAAVLALIFMLSRGGGGDEAAEGTTGDPQGYAGAPSTFADNGEAAGALSSAITDGLSSVSTALYAVDETNAAVLEGLADLGERIDDDEVPPVAAAPGPAGESGQPAGTPGKKPTPRRDKFGRTAQDRAKIKRERLGGKENKQGWTPTERRLADKNAKFSNFLVGRTRQERKEARQETREKRQERRDKREPDARMGGAKNKPERDTGPGRIVHRKGQPLPRRASQAPAGQKRPPAKRRQPAARRR